MRFNTAIFLSLLLAGVAQALTAPDCQSAAAPNQTALTQVRTANTTVLPGYPFGLVYAAEEEFAFVSLTANRSTALGVLDTTSFPPTLAHLIKLNDTRLNATEGVLGLGLTKNGNYLFVSAGTGAYIVDTSKAIKGDNSSVVGILEGRTNATGNEAIEVTLTHDGSYAFVSQEYGTGNGSGPGNIDVFKLDYSSRDAVSSRHIGHINLGGAVVGSALSPDEQFLYVTSEVAHTSSIGGQGLDNHGLLSVLNVTSLKSHPEEAQIVNVTAGCNPVREIVSSDGQYVWVSARASNYLLGFNASALIHDPANALLASVQVGTLPVGLAFVKDERYIITADSARFPTPGAHTGLTVVDVEAALAGSTQAVPGYIPTGLFPREFAVAPCNTTLLVADFSSRLVQAVDLTTLL